MLIISLLFFTFLIGKEKENYKSPNRALFYSLIFPGAGQFYTKNYLKGSLFLLAEGSLTYFIFKAYKNNEKGKFSDLLWILAGVHIFNMADAYISAHFYRFKEETRLTFYYVY
ncbi:MAG: DUF5683 domain-containing protein [candidate division WOR-3 bacterium]|nr:DUF5683 domain-containing protein [candidate division WOR-3 bacterium]MCX7837185.1 DUF5683 domain-containing protein [candidate division WOR-3 bacterium]MDW8114465.1 DUF5683 domain-containing protein [candidate division WOR-3 bacterium]